MPERKKNPDRIKVLWQHSGVEVATQKGLEPSTSAVTGRRSNQLSYCANDRMVGTVGIEPTTPRV
jgi:hypothetical protein